MRKLQQRYERNGAPHLQGNVHHLGDYHWLVPLLYRKLRLVVIQPQQSPRFASEPPSPLDNGTNLSSSLVYISTPSMIFNTHRILPGTQRAL